MIEIYWYLVLALVAFVYAAVGHGGASAYLALMALIGIETHLMRSTALTLNLFVSLVAFINYYRGGHFKFKLLWPFLITSMPMAFWGATIHVNPSAYKIILGVFLVLASARMLFHPKQNKLLFPFTIALAMFIGAVLGFFSGVIGIGGGIILSPILIVMGWANLKEAAAISALFIFLNSATGLAGLAQTNYQLVPGFYWWVIVGVSAGLLGSWLGSTKISFNALKYVLAMVLIVASIKLFVF
jgi:uncharacterized protein